MKNNKILLMFLIIIIIFSILSYFYFIKNKASSPVTTLPPAINVPGDAVTNSMIYSNKEYGFEFTLPKTWSGYSIIKNAWTGSPISAESKKETGPKLLIRNPKWTQALPYEDMPILIFTLVQWDSYIKENFSVSAAPIQATELGRNNNYIFALPARWDFDYSKDYEEAQNIIKSNPLKGFDI